MMTSIQETQKKFNAEVDKDLKFWSGKHQQLIDKLKDESLTDEEHDMMEKISTIIDNLSNNKFEAVNEKQKPTPIPTGAIKHHPYGHIGATVCLQIIGELIKPHKGETWEDVTCDECIMANRGEKYWTQEFEKTLKKRIKLNVRYFR